jgi:PAS domain S-box-containing protein
MSKLKIKTIGIIVVGTLILMSFAIINLAYTNINSSIEANKLWEETYSKENDKNTAFQFLHHVFGNEIELDKLRNGVLIEDLEKIEALKANITHSRQQLEATKKAETNSNGDQHYEFITKLLNQYEVIIHASVLSLGKQHNGFEPTLIKNFNNYDAYNALIYLDQSQKNSLLTFSKEANKHLFSLTRQADYETIIAAIIILLASLSSIYILRTKVMTPLAQLQGVMSNIAVGDYSVDVPGIARRDEIGEMARSLEILRDDAAELENVKEKQLLNERRIAKEEKSKRKTEELRSQDLADEVARQTLKLRKSEESFRGILDSALDAFISANEQGEILSFNKSAEKMFGYTAKEAKSLTIHALVPDEFRNEHEVIFNNSGSLSRPIMLGKVRHLSGKHKDGKTFPVSVGLTSLKHENKQVFVAVIRDRSEEVESEQKLQRLGRLLDRSAREVYVLDGKSLAFQEANSRAVDILGYSAEKLKTMKYSDILGSPTMKEVTKVLRPLLNGEKEEVILEGTHICKDGSQYPIEVNFHYWTNEFPPVFLAVAQDMTARLKVRQEILDARDVAESASKAKSFFLANMSHELRTPLNAVLGYSEMLKEIAEENDHLDYADDLDKISISAEHLLTLINDILDLSKITSGKADIVCHKTDVIGLVSEAKNLINPLILAGENEFIIETPNIMEPMYSDEVRIRQVLINVLSNASKFTNNGTIKLVVEPCKKDHKDHVKFIISDTGIGIPEDSLDNIFDEFTQANNNRETKTEGSGLGLSICRRLCRAMLGDITITSEIGVGTTVTLVLPNDISENIQDNSSGTMPANQNYNDQIGSTTQQRVVVIESDIAAGEIIKAYLEIEDFDVELANSAIDGLSLIRSFKPDTVLLDVSIPNINGHDTIREINSEQNIRLIFCSENENALQDSIIDTDNYILKPIDKEILIQKVRGRILMAKGAVS